MLINKVQSHNTTQHADTFYKQQWATKKRVATVQKKGINPAIFLVIVAMLILIAIHPNSTSYITGLSSGSLSLPNFNLTVNKSDNPNPAFSDSFRKMHLNYTIKINNTGAGPALNVTLREFYSPNVTFINATPFPTSGNATWFIGNMSAGNVTIIRITVGVRDNLPAGTIIRNRINISARNNTDKREITVTENTTIIRAQPNITVTKAPPSAVFNGTLANWTITINNSGPGTAVNLSLHEKYPVKSFFVTSSPMPSTSDNRTFFIGNMSGNSVFRVNITIRMNQSLTQDEFIVNIVNATWRNFSTTSIYLEFSPTKGYIRPFNVTVTKSFPSVVNNGSLIRYNITITNHESKAINISLLDIHPRNTTNVSKQGLTFTFNRTLTHFPIIHLLPGATKRVNLTLRVNASALNGTRLNNTLIARIQFAPPNILEFKVRTSFLTTVNASVRRQPNISVSKGAPLYSFNSTLSNWTILVNNSGPGIAYNLTLFEKYPAKSVYVSSSISPATPNNRTFFIGNLSNNTVFRFNISIRINQSITQLETLVNNINATWQNFSTTSKFAEYATSIGIIRPFNVTITKSHPVIVNNGSLIRYNITIINKEAFGLNISVTDIFPKKTTNFSKDGVTTLFNRTHANWFFLSFPPATTKRVNLTLRVNASLANGTLLNNTLLSNLGFSILETRSKVFFANVNAPVATPAPPAPPGGGGSPPACVDKCSTSDPHMCAGGDIVGCGEFNSDACYEYGIITECDKGCYDPAGITAPYCKECSSNLGSVPCGSGEYASSTKYVCENFLCKRGPNPLFSKPVEETKPPKELKKSILEEPPTTPSETNPLLSRPLTPSSESSTLVEKLTGGTAEFFTSSASFVKTTARKAWWFWLLLILIVTALGKFSYNEYQKYKLAKTEKSSTKKGKDIF